MKQSYYILALIVVFQESYVIIVMIPFTVIFLSPVIVAFIALHTLLYNSVTQPSPTQTLDENSKHNFLPIIQQQAASESGI